MMNFSLLAQPSIRLIEGAFIYRFTHFIDWNSENKNFNICIYKDKDVYNSLKDRTQGKTVKGLEISILDVSSEPLNKCQMLFLGKAIHQKSQKESFKSIKDNKIFVVSRDKLNPKVSMIRLKVKERKLSFDANKTLMNELDINISSKILRLADEVY
ncbi:MAG: hypothetical protein BM556_04125 [Bacteriovorax sp. MedPE-SWde]|nr:MAG: hypothetical protein BM556_04125 [Bacteriovorax sp. MedPE-SWde]